MDKDILQKILILLSALILFACGGGSGSSSQQGGPAASPPELTDLNPEANDSSVPVDSLIAAIFDKDMDEGEESTFVVYGSQTGKLSGTYTGGGSDTLNFNSDNRFKAGEEIEVILTDMLTSTDGQFLELPFVYSFRAQAMGGIVVFTQTGTVLDQTNVQALVAGDWDGDGDLDLAAANYGVSSVNILKNNGVGDFTVAGTVSGQTNVWALVAGDWDGDGDLDLAAANSGDSVVNILRNDGVVGNQIIFAVAGTVSGQTNVHGLAAGDWDGDGDLDLAAANYGASSVDILRNDGTVGLQIIFTVAGTVSGQTNVEGLAAGDWDGDGDLDLAAANSGNSTVSVLENDGSGGFTEAGTVSGQTNVQALVAGDFNGDGILDLAAANFGASRVDILRNDGVVGNQIIFTVIDTVSGQTNVFGLAAADLDGDGDLDLAAANRGNSFVAVLKNEAPP
jgi:hypothetical protein